MSNRPLALRICQWAWASPQAGPQQSGLEAFEAMGLVCYVDMSDEPCDTNVCYDMQRRNKQRYFSSVEDIDIECSKLLGGKPRTVIPRRPSAPRSKIHDKHIALTLARRVQLR